MSHEGRCTAGDARGEVLARIRAALVDVPRNAAEAPIPRDYERERAEPRLVELFAERVADYGAEVKRVERARVSEAVARSCRELGLRRLVIAAGAPPEWRVADAEVFDERWVNDRELDGVDGVISGCAVAIAETGTILLDGGPRCGRRAITLVPDHHICIVEAEQIVALVPEAFARLESAVRERRAPITLISGPSATSDIELNRVEGVHGPRQLLVLVAA